MKGQNVYTNKKTQVELERELKRDAIVDREIDGDTTNYLRITALMDKIEQERYSSEYTQKELAKKAGIGFSTYKDYLSGTSDNIKLKTVINIAHALRCKPSDLIKSIDRQH